MISLNIALLPKCTVLSVFLAKKLSFTLRICQQREIPLIL